MVIDGRAHMLGRLASIVAKQILSGHHVVGTERDSSCLKCRFALEAAGEAPGTHGGSSQHEQQEAQLTMQLQPRARLE